MRGRLDIFQAAGVRPLVPGLRRNTIEASVRHRAHPIIDKAPPPTGLLGRLFSAVGSRRWAAGLGDDLELIPTRATIDVPSLSPLAAPSYMPSGFTPVAVPSASSSAPDFWSSISSGVGKAVASVLPAFAQVKTAQVLSKEQGNLIRTQGANLYTPSNMDTLVRQAQFEQAQRTIDANRMAGSTGLPIDLTTIALIAGGGLLLWKLMGSRGGN